MAWLTNWIRRKQITVNGTTAGIQSDYQMKLTVNQGSGIDSAGVVNLGGNVLGNFSDLRFTKSDGTTLLNYWIESITGSSPTQIAIVWIRVAPSPDTIPVSPGTYNFYIYYNNPSATTAIDGSNTFQFFDDFASYSGSINGQGGWVTTAAGSSSATVVSGILDLYRDGINDVATIHNIGTLSTKFVYTLLSRPQNFNSNKNFYVWESLQYATTTSFWYERSAYAGAARTAYGEGLGVTRLGTPTYNVYHKVEIFVDTTGSTITHKYYEDGNLISGTLTTTKTSTTQFNRISFSVASYDGIGHHYIDYVHIRKYASPEPIWGTVGTEQQSVTLNISSSPTGAEIWLRSPAGSGSYTDIGLLTTSILYVAPDTYDIKLTLGGYQDWYLLNQTFTIGYIYDIPATLISIPGSLSISSTPIGAEIYLALVPGTPIDKGVQTTTSGTTITNLSPGTYNITLKLTGYQDWTGTAIVTSNSTTPISATFAGSAYITSTPSGAEIYLAVSPGTAVDQNIKTPIIIINLTAASSGSTTIWNYKLTLSGYADTSGSFTATAGSTIDIPVILPGSLYITSIPTGASIYIDNVLQ